MSRRLALRSVLSHVCLAVLLVPLAAAPLGCVTREVMEGTFERGGVEVSLREIKRGFTVVPREFQHPLQISPQRLANILSAIDIRGREAELAGIRSAFEPSQLQEIAAGLVDGLRKASPDQEIVVQVIRKQMQHLIFDRKKLTSFVAYAQDDLLYLHFSRVDWEIPERVKKTALPIPRVNEHPMKFRVVPSQGMFAEGVYAVAVEWQDAVFQQPLRRVEPGDERRERTILLEAPDLPPARRSTLPAELLPYLTPTQLRALADLEEARQEGRLTEGHYRREREKILDAARKQAATSE
jgi:hypothetical protein